MGESSTTDGPSRLTADAVPASELKQCCAHLYQTDVVKWLLGESYHPGGLALTKRLGEELQLCADDRVLDVASGQGSTALFLAEHFGCEVVGMDYGAGSVQEANDRAAARKLGQQVRFEQADAESMPFADASFDALVCECAFCTFPDKARAAQEFARVLRPCGRLGLSDLSRARELSGDLHGLLAWISCIADARPIGEYVEALESAGLVVSSVESHADALRELVRQVQGKLLGIDVLTALKQIELPDSFDLAAARRMAAAAAGAVMRNELGYVLITAIRTKT